jgi:hypothetical protein
MVAAHLYSYFVLYNSCVSNTLCVSNILCVSSILRLYAQNLMIQGEYTPLSSPPSEVPKMEDTQTEPKQNRSSPPQEGSLTM